MFISTKLCRLCRSCIGVSSALSDFDSDGIIISDKLKLIAPGILEPNYELPNGICTDCITQLNQAYKFVSTCWESQQVFKQYLKQPQGDTNCETDSNIPIQSSSESFILTNVEQSKNITIVKENIVDGTQEYKVKLEVKCEQESDYETEENMHNYDFKLNKLNSETDIITKVEEFDHLLEEKYFKTEESINKATSQGFPVNSEDNIQCNSQICERVANDNSNIEKCANPLKPHQCKVCEKAFAKKSDLIKHALIHTNVKRYKCYMCKKAFLRNDHLMRHERIHDVEKPFRCEACGKTFTRNEYLKRHLRKHTNDKVYKCVICQTEFSDKNYLLRHIRTHTKETFLK